MARNVPELCSALPFGGNTQSVGLLVVDVNIGQIDSENSIGVYGAVATNNYVTPRR